MNPALALKPIHLPAAPSWWPPAPGWWLLAVLLLLLLALAIWGLLRWRSRRQKRRWLSAQLARLADAPNGATELHRLLRRAIQPLLAQRHLSEADWPQLLQQLAGQPLPELLQLEALRYQPAGQISPLALAQADGLLKLALLRPRRAKKRLAVPPAPSPDKAASRHRSVS